jgi:uncharacterized protein YlxW (UPF0749 family)
VRVDGWRIAGPVIGNTLLLHGRTYSPPYRISAIGDPVRLMPACTGSLRMTSPGGPR